MKIANINGSNYKGKSFSGIYKTEDILRVVTDYPYKKKGSYQTIKQLMGVDILSDEFIHSLPEGYQIYGIVHMSVEDMCAEKICERNKTLKKINESFDYEQDREEIDSWFKSKIKELGKTLEIPEFEFDLELFKNKYDMFKKVIDELNIW